MSAKGRRRFLDFLQDLKLHSFIGSATEPSNRYSRHKLVWIQRDPNKDPVPGPSLPGPPLPPDLKEYAALRTNE